MQKTQHLFVYLVLGYIFRLGLVSQLYRQTLARGLSAIPLITSVAPRPVEGYSFSLLMGTRNNASDRLLKTSRTEEIKAFPLPITKFPKFLVIHSIRETHLSKLNFFLVQKVTVNDSPVPSWTVVCYQKKTQLRRHCIGHLLSGTSLLQLSDVSFRLIIRGGKIGGSYNDLATVSCLECEELDRHKRCTVVQHHPLQNAKSRQKRGHPNYACCQRVMRHLPNFEPPRMPVDNNQ